MRLGSGVGTGGRSRLWVSNWNVALKIAAAVVICHLLSVIAFSAQSTAAGGPLILFPLAILWRNDHNSTQATTSTPLYLICKVDTTNESQYRQEGSWQRNHHEEFKDNKFRNNLD